MRAVEVFHAVRLRTSVALRVTAGARRGTHDAAMPERLMLLDSASLYFRAFFGVPDQRTRPRRAADQRDPRLPRHDRVARQHAPADPARGLLGQRLAPGVPRRGHPDLQDAPVDRRTATWSRRGARRTSTPQVPVIVDALAALGIARVGVDGYEADDVIGTLTHRVAGADGRSTSSPGTATCSSWSTTRRRCGCSTPPGAACVTPTWSTRRSCGRSMRVASGPAYADMADPARRHQRRAAGRGRDRREDRGDADRAVRRPGRPAPGRSADGDPLIKGAQRARLEAGRGLPRRRPAGGPRGAGRAGGRASTWRCRRRSPTRCCCAAWPRTTA